MPAKLVVTSGSASGSEFPIQDPVLRIGSGPQCEFCLQESRLASHAVTLEFRGNGYLLHNRSDHPVALAGQMLDLRESAPWSAGQEANLGHGLILRLDIDGDPAPAKAAGPVYKIEVDPEDTPDTGAPVKKKSPLGLMKNLQLVVILAAIPLCAWMLMADPARQRQSVRAPLSFSQLVAKLEENKTDKERGADSYRAILQRAVTAELRGDRPEARLAYGTLRDTLLLRPKTATGTFTDPDDEEVWRFVTRRLQALYSGGDAQ